jgi:uncharacterized protein
MKSTILDQFRSSLLRIAEKNGIEKVYVFGSVARGEDRERSDVDFLIELKKDASNLGIGAFQYEAEILLGTSVDVVPMFALDQVEDKEFVRAVRSEAVPL